MTKPAFPSFGRDGERLFIKIDKQTVKKVLSIYIFINTLRHIMATAEPKDWTLMSEEEMKPINEMFARHLVNWKRLEPLYKELANNACLSVKLDDGLYCSTGPVQEVCHQAVTVKTGPWLVRIVSFDGFWSEVDYKGPESDIPAYPELVNDVLALVRKYDK